jgi:hypothetical protein
MKGVYSMEINFIEFVITMFLIYGCLKPEIPTWVKIVLGIFFVLDSIGEIPTFFLKFRYLDDDEDDDNKEDEK